MPVDLMILGAQKCGTTSLARRLDSHPQLACSTPKEPHFFSTVINWQAELPRYHRLFPAGVMEDEGRMCFEASTSYTFHPHRRLAIWDVLRSYNPNLKFIYLVRHPVERILSAYMHKALRGDTRRPPHQVVLSEPLYLAASRYSTQIRPYIETFGRDRVLILELEMLERCPNAVDEAIAAFLDIDPAGFGGAGVCANVSVRQRKRPRWLDGVAPLSPWLRRVVPRAHRRLAQTLTRAPFQQRPVLSADHARAVLDALALEIDALEALMGRDLSHWRDWPRPPDHGTTADHPTAAELSG